MFWRDLPGRIAGAVIVIATPLVLLLLSLHFLATPAFVRLEYARPDFPAASGFTDAERLKLAEASLEYLRSDQGIEALQSLEHDGEPLYNTRELIHMYDVKVVMYWAFTVFWVALALLLVATIYVLSDPDLAGKLPVHLFRGSAILLIGLVSVGGMAAVSFNSFFVLFHRLFFSGDSWLFNATDSLIVLFPLPFWISAAAAWIVISVGLAIVVGAGAYLWPGWKHDA